MKDLIYLDNNATTKIIDQVWDTMVPYFIHNYANASSLYHSMGREANSAIEKARSQVSKALNCQTKEIFFNSGATESINTVLKGVYKNYQSKGKHIITAKTEHKAVLTTLENLEKEGALITYLEVDRAGNIDLSALEQSITPKTIMLCLMAANNETGLVHPLDDIAQICKNKDCLFFCDATQYIGKLPLDLSKTEIDILCLSAHKFHGPKGIGALFIRRKTKPIQIHPLIEGGGQEHGFRAGTYNVPNIVGLGNAIAYFQENNRDAKEIAHLRDYLETALCELPEVYVHAKQAPRLPNTASICFRHITASELMTSCPQLALSSGSACVSGTRDPSHVLLAMGISKEDALATVRFSLSTLTTQEEVNKTIELIKKAVQKVREHSPIWQLFQAGLIT
ncbi:cysteine desulfurase [Sphingobacterium sp. SRCM116780]|uniref:cysteine desulfurase family protein n=1 Tax=Sphingobacterium sp. SRCM116780 TaxID=2907623 RepID=UPI001F161FD7|nr:cysteine desulfurase family protein [Sphingobacterium sp. SRCM116780]UIR57927.1 cysteine desulfurase [Sphingobacterium sp. SRCM116780]